MPIVPGWVDDQQRVMIDNDPALVGTAREYRPATLVVELDDGGRVEITEPNRVKAVAGDPEEARLQAILKGQGKHILAALDRAGYQITRKPTTGRTS